jgi:hypothetical protein
VQGAGLSARIANTIATRVTVQRPKVVIEHATYEHLKLSCRLGLMPACHGLEPLLQQMQWPSLFTPKNILTGEQCNYTLLLVVLLLVIRTSAKCPLRAVILAIAASVPSEL